MGLLGLDGDPWDLIPTLCFGAGAGLVLGVLLYAAGVRVWRPAATGGSAGSAEVSAGRDRSAGSR